MKKKIINFIFCLFCMVSFILLLKQNKEVGIVIKEAVSLFFNRVFISLFPMFILNDLLTFFRFPNYMARILEPIFKKVLKIRGIGAYIFLMSILSGTPSNAYLLKSLVQKGQITTEEAEHYLNFIYFSNPLFLLTMLSTIFPIDIGIKIIIIHYFSNVIIAFLSRKQAPISNQNKVEKQKESFSATISASIKHAMDTLLMVLGTITFYMVLSFLLLYWIKSPMIKAIVSGTLELTNGLSHLSNLSCLPKLKEIMAISMISFGGLSIHTQVESILEDTEIQYRPFLTGRIMQVGISVILILLF